MRGVKMSFAVVYIKYVKTVPVVKRIKTGMKLLEALEFIEINRSSYYSNYTYLRLIQDNDDSFLRTADEAMSTYINDSHNYERIKRGKAHD